jgi:hypothetical protein
MVVVVNDFSYHFDCPSEIELCDCDESHVELMSLKVEHEKREYYWIIKEYLCMNCEMMWLKRTYCVGKGNHWEIIQEPYNTGDEV